MGPQGLRGGQILEAVLLLAPPATPSFPQPPLYPLVVFSVMDWAAEGRKSLFNPLLGIGFLHLFLSAFTLGHLVSRKSVRRSALCTVLAESNRFTSSLSEQQCWMEMAAVSQVSPCRPFSSQAAQTRTGTGLHFERTCTCSQRRALQFPARRS